MELSASNNVDCICWNITSILIEEAIDEDKEPDDALLQSMTLDSLCAFQHNLSCTTDWDWDNSVHGMAVTAFSYCFLTLALLRQTQRRETSTDCRSCNLHTVNINWKRNSVGCWRPEPKTRWMQ